MPPVALLAPGYQGNADQAVLRKLSVRLESSGIVARAMQFGKRARPSRDYTAELDELRGARDSLVAEHPGSLALVGRSFGGRMCTFLAEREPPAALVVLGYPVSPPGRPRPRDEAALAALTCPTLIVQGDRDDLGPLDVLQGIAAANPRVEVAVVQGAGHSYGRKEAEAVEMVVVWLERVLALPP